jgi:hypothetical protein
MFEELNWSIGRAEQQQGEVDIGVAMELKASQLGHLTFRGA